MPIGQTEGSIVSRRRLAAPPARGAQAAAALAALLGLAAPAAAQAPPAPPGPALGNTTSSPAAPSAPPAPAAAPPAPAAAPPAPAAAPPAPAAAPPAPAGGALMPAPQGYYLLPPPLPPWANPRTIQYEEGDPIPRGYALQTRPDRALIGAGLLTFGVPYALSFTIAGIATFGEDFDEFGPLFIPFAGPLIAAETMDAEGMGVFWLTMDAVAQVGGLLLYAAGLAHEDVYLERQFKVSPRDSEHAASRWPAISIGASSAELRWRF
ncbi:hypothetical protein [Sorangium sp. So ce1078]|uniref:hypothetical protein n=1 Tax=Sorangium sp. So ce1078 TaxID=3133329 RepID=UPI003F5EC7F9